MGLKSGLYVMVVAEVEGKNDDSDEFSRCIGASYIGEIPRQFRELFFQELFYIFWHDERDSDEQNPFYISLYDHVIPDDDAQSNVKNPTEKEMLRLVCKSRLMPPTPREMLDIAVGIASDIRQIIIEDDEEPEDVADILERSQGRWVSFGDFSNRKINSAHYTKRTLQTYRNKVTWSQKTPTIGRDRGGNILKRDGDKPNSSYQYFLQSIHDKTCAYDSENCMQGK